MSADECISQSDSEEMPVSGTDAEGYVALINEKLHLYLIMVLLIFDCFLFKL